MNNPEVTAQPLGILRQGDNITPKPFTCFEICCWLTPCGYTRKVRPHFSHWQRHASTCLYLASTTFFFTF